MTTMTSYLFLFAVSNVLIGFTEGFILPKHFQERASCRRFEAATRRLAGQSSSNEDDGIPSPRSSSSSDLSWLKKAMDNPTSPEPDGLVVVESKPGISGFAVDPDLGFVVVMVGGDRATYAIVSPKDKERVRSAAALCLVQLAGGLDLGTPVLPPDILARLVADEVEGKNARELRPQVELLRVDAVGNDDEHETEEKERIRKHPNPAKSTPERDLAIESQAPKVFSAVNKLPGLLDCTQEQVVEVMKLHADDTGKLDRAAFNEFLDTLRHRLNATGPSKVKFVLVVSLNGTEMSIPAPSTVVAIGLALRYKVDVVVSEECQVEGFDVMEIASRFPAFRPIKELHDDARIMDGFIPSMFNQAAAPDNEDKM